MAKFELTMPKMGESIMEATILKWVKQPGDTVSEDETILEIATDKVDSEIPSPVDGVIKELLYKENDIVEVGKVIAILESEVASTNTDTPVISAPAAEPSPAVVVKEETSTPSVAVPLAPSNGSSAMQQTESAAVEASAEVIPVRGNNKFYSPLVRNIAQRENISLAELEQIPGSGKDGRVSKKDILHYLNNKSQGTQNSPAAAVTRNNNPVASKPSPAAQNATNSFSGGTEIIEMDRMRKLIADHMVMSKHTSPHVTSFVEADVTNIVNWRNKVKKDFQAKYNEKITFTPIFMEAVIKALHDYPMVNISMDGDKIIKKNYINLGMATALPSGNLIVPVIKQADHLNLLGLTKAVNDLANRARNNKLSPTDIQDGTFTVTNVGTFGNVMGTPIINQPQVAILATGAIRKKPAVVETEHGDLIAVRQMVFLSLSYDHRVVDGFLGGSFLRRIADYLEAFDSDQTI
jgi:2-oxoglutarate dehydrogenase E2 component (dihydrolipoamide succinyltransferase)